MMTFCGGAMAQDEGTSGGGFSSGLSLNTNNKYQISLLLGNQVMFNQNLTYLTPKYSNDAGVAIGLPGTNSQSENPISYIRFNDLGQGNLVNMAGVQFTYFLTDGIDINASFGMDLRSTPKKDFVEGEQIKDMAIQGQKWIEGQFQNNWLLTLGGNYHFTVSNEKIDLYAGLQFGYQHGHINTYTPYTDADYAYLTSGSAAEAAAAAAAKNLAEAQSNALAKEVANKLASNAFFEANSNYNLSLNNWKANEPGYAEAITNAKTGLSNAKTNLENAVKNRDDKYKALTSAQEELAKLELTDPNYAAAQAAVTVAENAYNVAQTAYNTANNTVTSAQNTLNTKQSEYDAAKKVVTDAEETKDKAYDAYANANSEYIDAQGKVTAAQSEAQAAKAQATEGGDASVLYTPRVGGGQVTCFTTSVMAGVNYALTDGLILGLEFSPYTFNYTLLEVCPQDNRVYQASAFANRFFANTMLKIGFRF